MKKNNMLRIASVLLVAVLLSTCAISGAFAKYTTKGEADAELARVANFGVAITGAQNLHIANATYNAEDTGATNAGLTLAVSSEDDVMAPGTTYTLDNYFTFSETNREVAVSVSYKAELTLSGWTIDGQDYCPLTFKVGGNTVVPEAQTMAGIKEAVEKAIEELEPTYVGLDADNEGNVPNVSGVVEPTIAWTWGFDVDDTKDTALGQMVNKPTVDLKITAVISQVN